jgi:hypothetical protein
MKIALDGAWRGQYRGDCECGSSWTGVAELHRTGVASPALPIAEAVVHKRMMHEDQFLELVFTERFCVWLERFWDRMAYAEMIATARSQR